VGEVLIRNDDVAADTTLHEIQRFCSICDRHGVQIVHAITPRGFVRPIHSSWSNEQIIMRASAAYFSENRQVVEYLRSRKDGIAVHGLYHTHCPPIEDLVIAKIEIDTIGLDAQYYVPPFNEGPFEMDGFKPLGPCPRLEEFLGFGDPKSDLVYLHSWRFEYGPFTWAELETCLKRLIAQ
jgi:hypothetical protein